MKRVNKYVVMVTQELKIIIFMLVFLLSIFILIGYTQKETRAYQDWDTAPERTDCAELERLMPLLGDIQKCYWKEFPTHSRYKVGIVFLQEKQASLLWERYTWDSPDDGFMFTFDEFKWDTFEKLRPVKGRHSFQFDDDLLPYLERLFLKRNAESCFSH